MLPPSFSSPPNETDAQTSVSAGSPWGFWAMLGLGAAVAVLSAVAQIVMSILYIIGLTIAGHREVFV
jgi:hypothetical protein